MSSLPLIALSDLETWRSSGVSQNFNVLFLAPIPSGSTIRIITSSITVGKRSAGACRIPLARMEKLTLCTVTECRFVDCATGKMLACGGCATALADASCSRATAEAGTPVRHSHQGRAFWRQDSRQAEQAVVPLVQRMWGAQIVKYGLRPVMPSLIWYSRCIGYEYVYMVAEKGTWTSILPKSMRNVNNETVKPKAGCCAERGSKDVQRGVAPTRRVSG